jgi:ankyrin repeat protein
VLKVLLDSEAAVEARTTGGYTALQLAASSGRVECVKVLLAAGAKMDKDAVEYAQARGHQEVVELLKNQTARTTAP